jgi:ribosomal protein S18 acetylase RimI-like enzyme
MPAGDPVSIDVAGARPGDISVVQAIDERVLGRAERREFLRRAVEAEECLVARFEGVIAGFSVVDRSFYDQRFIALLIVDPDHQRRGIGSALMRAIEARFPGEKLFTSTNASNLKMQALCERLGYVRSGYIENLDEDDPEIIYFKQL